MAILIHKIQKLKDQYGREFFSYEMTPEKKFQLKKKSETFAIDVIDLNHKEEIIIADRNFLLRNDLKNYLNDLDYQNIYSTDNPDDLSKYIQSSKFEDIKTVVCFCDYTMLLVVDWQVLRSRLKKDKIQLSIIAMLPHENCQNFKKMYNANVVDTIIKPIRLNTLRKTLYKNLSAPIKKYPLKL
jgi:DNA-binding NtrC family response regulator